MIAEVRFLLDECRSSCPANSVQVLNAYDRQNRTDWINCLLLFDDDDIAPTLPAKFLNFLENFSLSNGLKRTVLKINVHSGKFWKFDVKVLESS